MRNAPQEQVAFPGPPAAQPIPGASVSFRHELLVRFSLHETSHPGPTPALHTWRQPTRRTRQGTQNVVESRGRLTSTEPRGCRCLFKLTQPGDVRIVGPPATKVTKGGLARTYGGQGLGGAGREAAAGVRRPIACFAAAPRHSLPGRRSRRLQTLAARSGGKKPGASWGPLPRANPPSRPFGPLTGRRLDPRTPRGSHSAGSPTPACRTAGLGREGEGRSWQSAGPPSGGSWEAPRDWGSRSSPALPGWPVVCLMRAASPVAGRTRRRRKAPLKVQPRLPKPEFPVRGRS